ncbi:unnamed protein product [Peronospora destructor]|uniref:Uncharacterized protein n=1 Tax=Peronospora destructor TaxID=86335 RepID=A0AAV0UDG7_9STRA|nr:unnamed protein product [Peronospora destructor]
MRPTAVRHFHSTQPQPWLVPVGLACAGMFIGSRYIMRVQERIRRRRAGLVDDEDDDKSDKNSVIFEQNAANTGRRRRARWQEYSPEWATEIMLDYLHTTAVSSLGDDPMESFSTILAVPAGTDEHERAEYEQVANSAGFNVVAAIDEPVAALHAVQRCVVEELHSPEIMSTRGPIAVLDIGGYVSTVSLLEKERDGIGFSLLHTMSTVAVSGHQVNELLFRSVVEKFKEDHGIELSVDYMASYRILKAVESAKIELSNRLSSDINLPFITADRKGAKHLMHKITAFDLAHVQEGPAREAIALCNQALYEAGVLKQDLSGFVLIGGGAKSKFMRQQLNAFFKRPAFEIKSFNPEEAVVLGASEYGRLLIQEY